jgi:hypothetical protein
VCFGIIRVESLVPLTKELGLDCFLWFTLHTALLPNKTLVTNVSVSVKTGGTGKLMHPDFQSKKIWKKFLC